jgi:hypothetical protein
VISPLFASNRSYKVADEPERKVPSNLPDPVVYGPSWPDLRLLLKEGRQILESRTNHNLRLATTDFTPDGTYTMGRFLKSHPLCSEGRDSESPGCSAVVERWWHMEDGSITRIELRDEIDVGECQFLTALRDFCPPSQQAFFDKYLGGSYSDWCRTSFESHFTEYTQEHGPVSTWLAESMLDATVLGFPALIPEVWLAAIGSDRTPDDEEYLSEHPQRVDFVMFAKGAKWVIEVDGPSHYASYDEGMRFYAANERIYTKNLRIERALRRQGWRLHRFSNLEVAEADQREFVRMTAALPSGHGFVTSSMLDEIAASDFALDDIPFP